MKVSWRKKLDNLMMTKMAKLSRSKLPTIMIRKGLGKMMKVTKLSSSKSKEKELKEKIPFKRK